MAATLDRRIKIVRTRISRTRGQTKLAEQYAILDDLMAELQRTQCQHLTTADCCDGWDGRCLDCGMEHV